MSILVFNAGSSTLKFSLLELAGGPPHPTLSPDGRGNQQPAEKPLRSATVDAPDFPGATRKIFEDLREFLPSVECIGHRVVHGGAEFRSSVRIDARVKRAISNSSNLAPLHNPPALEVIEAAEKELPDVPQIAVFDTAYFSSLPPEASVYPLPYEWHTEWGVRRYGFHGINHAWCARRAAELAGHRTAGVPPVATHKPAGRRRYGENRRDAGGTTPSFRVVTCHLGSGCSVAASRDGVAVATTMGYTPLDGIMMGTRSGAVDPGILLHALQERGLSPQELGEILTHRSGLLGVSGLSGDFREIERAMNDGHARARLAFTMFAASIRAGIGALAVALGGLDALVFSGGIGENSAALREEVCRNLGCLDVHINPDRNNDCRPDMDISEPRGTGFQPVRVYVILAREDLSIAREVAGTLSPGSGR